MSSRLIKFRAWDGSKYDIGSDGSVWSNDFNNSGKRGRLKLYKDRDGYNTVFLTINAVRRIYPVRRLVADTFLGKRPDGLVINHKNGIRDDDRAENLEYITHQQNVLHGYRSNGRKPSEKQLARVKEQFSGSNNPKAKLSIEDVNLMRNQRRHGLSLKTLSGMFGVSLSQVSAICTNRNWK